MRLSAGLQKCKKQKKIWCPPPPLPVPGARSSRREQRDSACLAWARSGFSLTLPSAPRPASTLGFSPLKQVLSRQVLVEGMNEQ